MNTIRKMKKNAKALSPVVASIILIAVTVAVSIAVAAWMGALVVGQMATENVKITSMTFDTSVIVVKVSNTGTTAVTISEAWVNNVAIADDAVLPALPTTVEGNAQATLNITATVTAGYQYFVKLVSSQGNSFTFTANAPS